MDQYLKTDRAIKYALLFIALTFAGFFLFEVLKRLDGYLRAADPRVKQVMVSLSGGVDTVLIARSDGVLGADVRPLVRLNVQVIVEHGVVTGINFN